MAKFQHYRCPECEGVFKFLHERSDTPPPERCELCNAWMLDTPAPVFVPQAPRIGTYKGAVPDQVYRQMEQASADRTELMAEVGGGSASDYKHTVITDLKDNTHEGEVAAKYYAPEKNYVQEFMRLNQQPANTAPLGGGFAPLAGATGPEYAAVAHTGAFPHAGAQTHDRITGMHSRIARQIEATGKR